MFVACAFGDVSGAVDVDDGDCDGDGDGDGIFVFHMHGGNFCDYVAVVVVVAHS